MGNINTVALWLLLASALAKACAIFLKKFRQLWGEFLILLELRLDFLGFEMLFFYIDLFKICFCHGPSPTPGSALSGTGLSS